MVYAKKGMLERLKAEGANSPADAVLTVDIGRLSDMVDAKLVQPVSSPTLATAGIEKSRSAVRAEGHRCSPRRQATRCRRNRVTFSRQRSVVRATH